jgi:hypothetical protein
VIVALGAVGTGAAVIWASGLRDDHGDALIDADVTKILIALLGAVGTLIGLLVKRTGAVEHQVTNNSGSTMKDATDRTEVKVDALLDKFEHLERAHRKNASDIVQLREDQQQTRADLSGQAADIRGIRKDIGRVLDVVTKKEP